MQSLSSSETTNSKRARIGKWQPVHLYLDSDFAEMATGFQIFERRRDILHLERLVDYWLDTEVFDHADHSLEHLDRPDDHPLNATGEHDYCMNQPWLTTR